MDVKTAFLKEILREEIYIDVPARVILPRPGLICRLHKTSYGLKQSPREWFHVIDSYLVILGFIKSTTDRNVYHLKCGSSFVILMLYVDDIMLATNSLSFFHDVKTHLHSRFPLSDLGDVHHILSLQVMHSVQQGWLHVSHTSGFVFLLSQRAVNWYLMCQRSIAMSSMEAEYMAMATAASEVVWLWQLFHDLNQAASLHEATLIQCDNQLALALVDTTKFHSQTKHIVVRYHFIPQLTTQQKIRFQYCLTSEMRVYIFTKFLTGLKLTPHLR